MLNNVKKFYFIPDKIMYVREEVEKTHRLKDVEIEDYKRENRVENMIKIIEGLKNNQLKAYSITLNRIDIDLLIRYISNNIYDTELIKIYEIIEYSATDENLQTIYLEYQNNYKNKDVIFLFSKLLELVNVNNLNLENNYFKDIKNSLDKEDKIDYFKSKYRERNIKTGVDEYIDKYKFDMASEMKIDLLIELLTISNRDQLIKTNSLLVKDIIKLMNTEARVIFFSNYILKLEFSDYKSLILDYFYAEYNRPDNKKFNYFWKNIDKNVQEIYIKWLNIRDVEKFFDGDERFSFWHKYIMNEDSTILNVNEDQLFLEFESFYVVEFREIGNAAYLYPDYEFEKHFYKLAKSKIPGNNNEFKSYRSKKIDHSRIIHSGTWQTDAALLIWEWMK